VTNETKSLPPAEEEKFIDWFMVGLNAGWISDVVCATHNGLPLTEEEESEWDEGFDPCVPGVRIWVE
jgi:hypothetical protein